MLQDRHAYTQEMISAKIGKKRSTIAEILAISEIPEEIKDLCRHADIKAKSLLLEISKAGNLMDMRSMVDAIMAGKGRETIRQFRKDKQKKHGFRNIEIKADDFPIRIKLNFQSSKIHKDDLIKFLQEIIERIKKEEIKIGKSG